MLASDPALTVPAVKAKKVKEILGADVVVDAFLRNRLEHFYKCSFRLRQRKLSRRAYVKAP